MDETGVFYRQLPDRTLRIKSEECKGGKKSKERLTAALCCNMLGEFEKTLVIGRCEKPRCFKNISFSTLPVTWKFNKKAWMDSHIYSEWLRAFDQRMQRQKRNVLLFIDNAPGHPKDTRTKNVKVVYLPKNTTSELSQPLDQGIIQTFKQHYRKCLLRAVIAKADSGETDVTSGKFINVLDAVHWIHSAVNNIKTQTVSSCFRKAGFPVEQTEEEDPEEDIPLAELIATASKQLKIQDPMTAEEFISTDEEVSATEELGDNWEKELVDDFISSQNPEEDEEQEEEEPEDKEEEECLIKDLAEALKMSRHLKLFSMKKGLSNSYSSAVNLEKDYQEEMVQTKVKCRQSDITSFFKRV